MIRSVVRSLSQIVRSKNYGSTGIGEKFAPLLADAWVFGEAQIQSWRAEACRKPFCSPLSAHYLSTNLTSQHPVCF